MVNPAAKALQTVADASFYRQYSQQVFELLYEIDTWWLDAPPAVRQKAAQLLDEYDPNREFAPGKVA